MPPCTVARLLAAVAIGQRLQHKGRLTDFFALAPGCTLHELSDAWLRSSLNGRSALFIGDCLERRMLEHLCQEQQHGGSFANGWANEHGTVACRLHSPNVTLGFAHLQGVGQPPFAAHAVEQVGAVDMRQPASARVQRVIASFRREVLHGEDVGLVTLHCDAWCFAAWAEADLPWAENEAKAGVAQKDAWQWWGARAPSLLATWTDDVQRLSAATLAAAGGSPLFWLNRPPPSVAYARGTVGRAVNRTVPNLPWAFNAQSEVLRSQLPSGVGLIDLARMLSGHPEAWMHGDGLHQPSWASLSFAKLLLNTLARLPRPGGAVAHEQVLGDHDYERDGVRVTA